MADRYDDRYRDDRNFAERAGDEVRSWFGDDEAARRRRMDEERYGRDADWNRHRDWGHRMGLEYERRPGRDWYDRDRTYASGGYGRAERGWSGERWGERDWDVPPNVHTQSFGHSTPSAGFGPGPGGYGAGYGRGFGMTSTGMPYAQPQEWRENYREGYAGRGPRGYSRSDERIKEDVCDRLTDDPWVDATEVEIQVRNGEVTLSGSVRDRNDKRRTEDIIESISGVRNVHNNLRVGTAPPATPNATRPDRG